jgi:hypothetical protein
VISSWPEIGQLAMMGRPRRDCRYVVPCFAFVYAAAVIDTFVKRTVDWWVSRSGRADFVLNDPERALCDSRPIKMVAQLTTATAACDTSRRATLRTLARPVSNPRWTLCATA